ncbi:MAG: isoprenoid biosynthesis glyoxalase ElbB [Planctomycetota bacterium]
MTAKKRIGVVLSGCGFQDGAEVHESVLTLLALDRAGCEILCFAPDRPQARVVDHRTGEEVDESRNVLAESARIARGEIRDLGEARAQDLDAVILPGGYGAALNLSDFATKGAEATVDGDLAALLRALHAAGKPIGAICIAPGVVAAALGEAHPTLTIGNDEATAAQIEACGAVHEACPVDGVVVDEANRIVSTPAYMLGPSIRHVAAGIERCVAEVLRLAGS